MKEKDEQKKTDCPFTETKVDTITITHVEDSKRAVRAKVKATNWCKEKKSNASTTDDN